VKIIEEEYEKVNSERTKFFIGVIYQKIKYPDFLIITVIVPM
jgi:hypothetical protein